MGKEGKIKNMEEIGSKRECLLKWGRKKRNTWEGNLIKEISHDKTSNKSGWTPDWNQMRSKRINYAIRRIIGSAEGRLGIGTEKRVTILTKCGFSRKSSSKIVLQTSKLMFQEYLDDSERKKKEIREVMRKRLYKRQKPKIDKQNKQIKEKAKKNQKTKNRTKEKALMFKKISGIQSKKSLRDEKEKDKKERLLSNIERRKEGSG